MPLDEYTVEIDRFKVDKNLIKEFNFPCCACIGRHGTDMEEPCRSCDHNLKSDKNQL